MGKSRVFFPQEVIDRWLTHGEAELTGAELWLRSERRRYRVVEAVRVVREVSGAPDAFEMSGRVKTLAYVGELEAELLGDSMIVGDNAYETVIGWLGMLARRGSPTGQGGNRAATATVRRFVRGEGASGDARDDRVLLRRHQLLGGEHAVLPRSRAPQRASAALGVGPARARFGRGLFCTPCTS